jgi:hypothetical protein
MAPIPRPRGALTWQPLNVADALITCQQCAFPRAKRFGGEYSDKGVSGQYLRPNLHPIYQLTRVRALNL